MKSKRLPTSIRKNQIIDAARKIIIDRGSEHLTIRAISTELDLSEGAIYRHFKNKQEILHFLINHIMSEMIDEISRESVKNSPTADSIGDILKNHLSRIKQRQGISFQVMAEIISFGDQFLKTAVYDNINQYIGELEKILAEGVRCGSIKDDIDLESTAMLTFGIIHGLVNIWALGSYGFDISKKFESLWEVFCKTLRHEQEKI